MKIGIVGGIGPESTVDYYKRLITGYQKIKADGSYPKIVIDSIDMKGMLDLVAKREWESLVNLLVGALNNLHAAGASFAVIASNTPHVVFDRVKDLSPIPVISIVEEACKKAGELKLKKVGLLGMIFTMKEPFYKNSFQKNGIEVIVPDVKEQEYIHGRICSELELGIVREDTKKEFLGIINRMIKDDLIEGLILGCTELPLILNDGDSSIPFLNTVEIHVESIIKEMSRNI